MSLIVSSTLLIFLPSAGPAGPQEERPEQLPAQWRVPPRVLHLQVPPGQLQLLRGALPRHHLHHQDEEAAHVLRLQPHPPLCSNKWNWLVL